MNWPVFRHEAMATQFEIVVAAQNESYARQAAAAAFRELDRLEGILSRYVESSDIGRANRLARGETIAISDDTFECLLLAADASIATDRTFDPAYASERATDLPPDAPPFTLDPEAHTLTSQAVRLHLDLGAIGKGFALDRLAETLREWDVLSACLNSGGSTALALAPPPDSTGWPVGLGEGKAHRMLALSHGALSGSGTAVKGAHLVDPRTGEPALRTTRAWAFAPGAATADALSTAFFVMREADIARFCAAHPGIGAATSSPRRGLLAYGALRARPPAGG